MTADPRRATVEAVLATLRDHGRRAVRIVDADCGTGVLLLHAADHARALGFTAIEARGIDGSPALIGRARAAANRRADPAIGVEFERSDMITALRAEHDLPADIVLCHGCCTDDRDATTIALRDAGRVVIDDRSVLPSGGSAA